MGVIARKFTGAGLVIALGLALAGCMHLDRSVALNDDGSGVYTLTIGFSQPLLARSGDQIIPIMDSYGASVRNQGGTFRYYDDAGYTYWAFTRPFKTVAALNILIQDQPKTGGVSNLVNAAQNTLRFSEQSNLLGNSFRVTGSITMRFPQNSTTNSGQPATIPPALKDMRESFSVTMPGSITAHNGGVVSGNTVTYSVQYGEKATIDVTGGDVSPVALLPFAIGAAVVLVAVIVGLTLWRRRSKTAAHPAIIGAPAAAPPIAPAPDEPPSSAHAE
jgi:hypothetical protein